MDVASLRRELEEHLKRHPHEQAPGGFRDRFEHWAEVYEREEDEDARAELAELLRKVPAEAEAAAKAGSAEAQQPVDEPPRPAREPDEAPRDADTGAAEDAPQEPPARRAGSAWLLFAAAALALAAAAYFYFRG